MAEPLRRGFHRAFHCRFIAHVGGHRDHRGAVRGESVGGRLRGCELPIEDRDRSPFTYEGAGDSLADPTRAAGDQRCFSIEPSRHDNSFS